MADLIAYGLDDATGEWRPQTASDDLVDTAGVKPTPGPHLLGGAEHSADTIANLNAKISDATVDDVTGTRTPTAHAAAHGDGGSDEVAVESLPTSGSVNTVPVAQADGSLVMALVSAGQVDSIIVAVRKASAGTINKGQAVYIVGFTGGFTTVELAKADAAGTMPSVGTADTTITDVATGNMVVHGTVSGFDTSMWSVGDDLYISETVAGGLKNTKPTGAANLVQKVAQVLQSDASTGMIEVFGAGRVNDLPNIAQDNIWKGDGSGVPQSVAFAHALGGAGHTADTLANLNSKVSDATLDDSSATRTPSAHAAAHQDGGADEVATTTPAANAIPKALGTGKLDIGWINGIATKEVFFPVDYATDRGDYRARLVSSGGNHRFNFKAPHDFVSITSLVLVGIPSAGAAGSGKDIDLASSYGANGENFEAHQETDTTTTYNLGSVDVFFELDISAVFSSLVAGDYAGVLVTHNAVGGDVHYLGLRLRYA